MSVAQITVSIQGGGWKVGGAVVLGEVGSQ